MKNTMTDVQDKALVIQAKKQDEKAFEIIIKKYEVEVYNYLCKITRDHMLAMDLLQETIIKAYKYLDRFDDKYSFKVWLFSLAKNVFIDETRKSYYKYKHCTDSFYDVQVRIPAQPVADEVEHQSLKDALAAAFERLPEKYRSILTLGDILELSYEEISAIEKISIGTVKSRLNRARNQLKRMKHLKQYL